MLALAVALSLGAAQECAIQDLVAHLNAIQTNEECQSGCNSKSADCPDAWIPGPADDCNAACARVFEPFWNACAEMINEMNMGGMEGMESFATRCLVNLYRPGYCGGTCTPDTLACRTQQVQEACCQSASGNCIEGESVPTTCPVGCAVVFPQFVETCRDALASTAGIQIAEFEAFSQACLDLDGMQVVQYAVELRGRGCLIELGELLGRRQMQQLIRGPLETKLSGDASCLWDDIDDLALEVDEICCPESSSCPDNRPTACTAACAIAMHQFGELCEDTLDRILPAEDEFLTAFEAFNQMCQSSTAGFDDFIHAIRTAQCPNDSELELLHELGATPEGWSNMQISTAGSAGSVHGPFGHEVPDVSIMIGIPPGITSCEISWRSWAVNSHDEVDRVLANGVEIWSSTASCSGGTGGWEEGPEDFSDPRGLQVCMADVVVDVPCSGPELRLNFVSEFGTDASDETWAFSDVHVVGSDSETVILDETRETVFDGATATDWSDELITNTGSAGNIHGPYGSNVTEVSITASLPPNRIGLCEISWRHYEFDSAYGSGREADRLMVNSAVGAEEAWTMPVIPRSDGACQDGW